MVEIKVEYTFYKNTYGGTLIPLADWIRKEYDARAIVSAMTFGRIYEYDLIERDLEAVKRAICAAAEKQYEADQIGNIRSENNDGYSVTFRTRAQIQSDAASIIRIYLADTTLMYRGVNYDYKR